MRLIFCQINIKKALEVRALLIFILSFIPQLNYGNRIFDIQQHYVSLSLIR